MRVWPSGCVCHAVRAPGSKVTLAACTDAGSCACKSWSMRTAPVNQSEGPLAEGCEPARLISIWFLRGVFVLGGGQIHDDVEIPPTGWRTRASEKTPSRTEIAYSAQERIGGQSARPVICSRRSE